MGISEKDFWEMNPRKIEPYKRAMELEAEKQNYFMYIQGVYFMESLKATVGNMFRKGTPLEYPKEPFKITGNGEMTVEEKIRQTEELFARLETMKHNFEMAKENNEGNAL